MSPTVSLLVPVFNRADLLVPCLESALAQTMPDFEVVVVDGASTDGTWDVCKRFAATDHRIRVFRDDINTGPVRGWWRCLEEARGNYATFLWSDDVLQPTFLASTLPALSDRNVAFVFTAAEIGPEPGSGQIVFSYPSQQITSEAFIVGSLQGSSSYPVSPACALFRLGDLRQSFMMELPTKPKIDLTVTGAGVDLLLYLLTALRYPRVASLSEPLAFFRVHKGSITCDGRGGQVALGYALARGWFARKYGHRDLARVILARHWSQQARNSRRFMSPFAAATRYGHIVGTGELTITAGMDVLMHGLSKARRVLAARIRRAGRSA